MMTEDTIFAAAIEKSTPAERTAYLDEACSGDTVLRQRIESLLQSHTDAGSFLGKPAIRLAAEELAGPSCSGETQGEPPNGDEDGESLDFLAPSEKPGSLGRLGHYEISQVIGRGGMGVVLKAFDESLHRIVAIKVMAPQFSSSATARKRFIREARAAAAVSHDHVVTIHAVEETSELPYIAMQYVDGVSLEERLERSGPLELKEILRIGIQTAAGLAAAHAQGLVHRDIKPANILLENGVERVKITDFGLARAVDDASLSQSGVVAGTPQYMAPEQARGESVDHRTDLFSLGSLIYAMCTGHAPFRASGTMAVLKRVCEYAPRPVREINAEIPEWLAAIIDKLHAKDPAQRYQSAAEVAELLSRHLAQVQHPSVVGQVSNLPPAPKAAWKSAPYRRRLAVAAAILILSLGSLSLSEATGVTNLRATVIRIFTPEGTLVVEVDDPGVKVTIEGDGGIVITGAGPQEVRLRPGSYKVRATKGGKSIHDDELVTITRGDKQVVKVSREVEPVTAGGRSETGAFFVLSKNGASVGKFDTLPEAVLGASAGDTIEIRGDGPFITESVPIKAALTIRAGEGFRPVIRLIADAEQGQQALLQTHSHLVLEGLEFQRMSQDSPKEGDPYRVIVDAPKAPVRVANCRFLSGNLNGMGITMGGADCDLRNCEIFCPSACLIVPSLQPDQRLIMENCVQIGSGFGLEPGQLDQKRPAFIELSRTTSLSMRDYENLVSFWLSPDNAPALRNADRSVKLLRVKTSGNIFDGDSVLHLAQMVPDDKIIPANDGERLLAQIVGWQGERNLYSAGGPFLRQSAAGKFHDSAKPMTSLEEWQRFWGSAETDSVVGRVRYQGGDLRAKMLASREKLTPEDFRLRPDSAGYRAGVDGKDLGADIDLVGPGPAYERWKKTPEYQQWLKHTGQVKE